VIMFINMQFFCQISSINAVLNLQTIWNIILKDVVHHSFYNVVIKY